MDATLVQIVESLRHCPVFKPAQAMWFRCKALELAARTFFRPPEGELFCTRQQRAACERAARVREILSGRLADPPSLEELGRLVGCSPFHLSRQFSETTSLTIQQFIRQLRLERAAELLQSGRCNVTEAALEVGYNSLSHFTVAFRETFGCCPGLYPLKQTSDPAAETMATRRLVRR
jgi:AraC-like DNA-binding protein